MSDAQIKGNEIALERLTGQHKAFLSRRSECYNVVYGADTVEAVVLGGV